MDTVFIEGLSIDASIGVFDWEKEIKQNLIFDLEIVKDFTLAAQTDNISEAIDYVAVSDLIADIVAQKHYQLLETLSHLIADKIIEEFEADQVMISVKKPGAVPQAQSVGVKSKRVRV